MADETKYLVLKELPADASTEEIKKAFEAGQRVWVELDGGVKAPGNTAAIVAATVGQSNEEKAGVYAAPSVRNFPIIPRKIRTEVVDDFGPPSTAGSRSRSAPAPSAKGTPGGGGGDA